MLLLLAASPTCSLSYSFSYSLSYLQPLLLAASPTCTLSYTLSYLHPLLLAASPTASPTLSYRSGCSYSGAWMAANYYEERRRKGMARRIPTVAFEEVERQLGRPIDTLLIDCEGCIDSVLEGQLHILRGVRLIILEQDMYASTSYKKWFAVLRREGFERTWQIHDTFDRRPEGKFAWWSTKMFHSVWQRVGVPRGSTPSCQEYKQRAGLEDTQLMCASGDDFERTHL